MGIFRRLLGGKPAAGEPPKPQRLDYLNEALALERQGDYDAAITSYRLALRDHPNDPRILQNLAIALERAGVARSVAMSITGHKTEAVYRRYAIVAGFTHMSIIEVQGLEKYRRFATEVPSGGRVRGRWSWVLAERR